MKLFWPIYLSSVAVGTVGMYVTAPLARPYVASALRDDFASQVSSGVPSASTAAGPAASPARPQGGVAAPSGASDAAQAEEEVDPLPAVLGVYLASYGDHPGWGITSLRTVYYTPDGTRVGNIGGGMVFNVGLAHKSTKGLMIECRFLDKSLTNGTFLVTQKDVRLFTGAYTNLTVRQRENLKAYYALNGKSEARKTDLILASATKNPHLAEANAAYKAYTASVEKSRELILLRDRAVDQERSRLEDQLHELKLKEIPLKTALDAANEKFRAWKLQHGGEVAKPDNDADIRKWRQEMADLRPHLPGLAL